MKLAVFQALQAKSDEQSDSLTCPKCGKTSHNPNDVKYAYCPHCGVFLRDFAAMFISLPREDYARRLGYVLTRSLSDGRFLGIELDLHGGAFLKLCSSDDPHSLDGVDDLWQYDEAAFAVIAAGVWDPQTQPEPFGFYRHPATGRRRRCGNPQAEYVLA
jgi:hypothetical protein